jgi:hypothetical protein
LCPNVAKPSASLVKPPPAAGKSIALPGPSGIKAGVRARTMKLVATAEINQANQKQMTDDEISAILENSNSAEIFQDIFTTPTRMRKG